MNELYLVEFARRWNGLLSHLLEGLARGQPSIGGGVGGAGIGVGGTRWLGSGSGSLLGPRAATQS